MRNLRKLILNEDDEKVIDKDEDEIELLSGEGSSPEVSLIDIKKYATKVISDEDWDVFIPRSNDVIASLGLGDHWNPKKEYGNDIYYVFFNKRGAMSYIYDASGDSFYPIDPGDKYQQNSIDEVDFFMTKASDKLRQWAVKRFKVLGRTISGILKANAALVKLNKIYTYPDDKNMFDYGTESSCFINGEEAGLELLTRGVEKIIVKEGVTELPSGIFAGFYAVNEVVLPKSLKIIGDFVLAETSITELNLPNGLTTIGANAFASNHRLKKVNIPDTVTSIGFGCFKGCAIEEFTWPSRVDTIPSACFYNNGAWNRFRDGINITKKIVIPNNVIRIGDGAFAGLYNVDVYIPKSVTFFAQDFESFIINDTRVNVYLEIDEDTFFRTRHILLRGAQLHFGSYKPNQAVQEGLNEAPEEATPDQEPDEFADIEVSDEPVELGVVNAADFSDVADRVKSDKNWIVWKPKTKDAMLKLGMGTTWLGRYHWNIADREYDVVEQNSWGLRYWKEFYVIINRQNPAKKFIFQSGHGNLYAASSARYSFVTWLMKNSLELANWFAKKDLPFVSKRLRAELTGLEIAKKGTYVYPDDGNIAKSARKLIKSIIITPGTSVIKDFAMGDFSLVTSINIPDGVTKIGDGAFYNCTSLTDLRLPNTLNEIANFAFSDCGSLTSITIPDGVTKIGWAAFQNCAKLSSVYIPNSVQRIDHRVFGGWKRGDLGGVDLTIYCEAEKKPSMWEDTWDGRDWYYRNETSVIWGATKQGSPIHEDVDDEGDEFDTIEVTNEPTELHTITAADITRYASKLAEDENWELWKPNSENGMILLSSRTCWLGSMEDVRNKVYDTVDPDSWTLQNWDKMYVILNKKKPEKKYTLQKGYSNLFAPSYSRYSAGTWLIKNSLTLSKWFADKKFPYISHRVKAILADMTISKAGIYNYPTDNPPSWKTRDKIKTINIVPGTTRIAASALSGFGMETIDIPDSVTKIGSYAFYRCNNLTSIKLPPHLTEIGDRAFSLCTKLKSVIIPDGVTTIEDGAFKSCSGLSLLYIPASVTHIGYNLVHGYNFNWGRGKLEPAGAKLTIYCAAASKPAGWDERWAHTDTGDNFGSVYREVEVVWGVATPPAEMNQ